MTDARRQGLINELMTAWQQGRGEYEIREAFADILGPYLIGERIQARISVLHTVNEAHEAIGELADIVKEAIQIDGAHHKQWHLQRMATLLGVQVEGSDPGIAP